MPRPAGESRYRERFQAASRITSITRENDDIIYYGYDDADRLTAEAWKDSGGSTIYAFEWDYDAVGNRTWQNRNSAQTYYSHDAGGVGRSELIGVAAEEELLMFVEPKRPFLC